MSQKQLGSGLQKQPGSSSSVCSYVAEIYAKGCGFFLTIFFFYFDTPYLSFHSSAVFCSFSAL